MLIIDWDFINKFIFNQSLLGISDKLNINLIKLNFINIQSTRLINLIYFDHSNLEKKFLI